MEKLEKNHPVETLPPFNPSYFDHMLYLILRHNILKVPFLANSDDRFTLIDSFILSQYVVNGTEAKKFCEKPVFSIPLLLKYTFPKSQADNPFLGFLNKMLRRACLMVEFNHGHCYENFHAQYEWLRLSMICHPTLSSFLTAYLDTSRPKTFNSFPTKKETTPPLFFMPTDTLTSLSELYPNFTQLSGSDSKVSLRVTPGDFLEKPREWLDSNKLYPGDVFIPTETNNKGFDLMIMTKRSHLSVCPHGVQESLEDFLILVECKHSDPSYESSLSLSEIDKKLRVLMKHYDQDQENKNFVLGEVVMPWERVAYVVMSSYHGHTAIPKTSTFSSFKGTILVSTRETASAMYDAPLNNCGALLQRVSHDKISSSPL